jgi:hypothetical protein
VVISGNGDHEQGGLNASAGHALAKSLLLFLQGVKERI